MNLSLKPLYLTLALAIIPAGYNAHAGTETSAAAAKAAATPVALSGKVLETMDGGGYTYILLKNPGENVWVAVPQMKVKVGQELTLVPGFVIKNFNSKGLNRKFDKVIFSAGVANQAVKLSPSAIKMVHQGVPVEDAKQQGAAKIEAPKPAPKPEPVKVGHVAKAKGRNAYTVAQLYAKKKELEKKPVVVRGKVVKVSSHILKKNWVHIQDGTGSEAKKNNNIVVTTQDLPNEGDVVTVKGTVYNKMDFGYGYRYELMLQDAKVK
jgi:hypothetical protein